MMKYAGGANKLADQLGSIDVIAYDWSALGHMLWLLGWYLVCHFINTYIVNVFTPAECSKI